MGVGCPCPPVRNDTVIPRHLFSLLLMFPCLLAFVCVIVFRGEDGTYQKMNITITKEIVSNNISMLVQKSELHQVVTLLIV